MTIKYWGVVSLLVLATGARAAELAFDSAADPVYNSTWLGTGNGGYGWKAGWGIIQNSGGTAFVRSSTTNGIGDPNGDGDIDTPHGTGGQAWGVLVGGNLFGIMEVGRPMNGDLLVGQTVELDVDTALPRGSVSWSLWPRLGNIARFTVRADDFTRANYTVTDGLNEIDSGVPVTDQGVHFAFTLTGAETYSLVLTPIATGLPAATITGSLRPGDSDNPDAPISSIHLRMTKGASAPPPEWSAYFNNVAITPEPATGAAAGLAAFAIAGRRGRRRSN